MNGSGPGRPGRGAGSGPPQGVIAAVVVLVALVLIGIAVVIGIRLGGSYLGEQTATGPVATSTKATTTRTPPAPRTSSPTSEATTTRRATAVCDARAINADLGYPGSGSRIIDCGSGWAVMASEHSGDPYWVSFRGGRWQTERDISMYLFTCPDEAIARGVPTWMANRHLTCNSFSSSTSTPRSSSRPTSESPRVSPSVRPSPSASPSPSSSASSSTSASATQTSEETTTTTSPSPNQAADTGEFD